MNKDNISCFIYDFDGVMTDNKVYLSQEGVETVVCNRSDGLAIQKIREKDYFQIIISTESNPVVKKRAEKLKIPVLHNISDKQKTVKKFVAEHKFNLSEIVYVGNDINDLEAMQICGMKICPADAASEIKDIADLVTSTKGGEGVIRELYSIIFKNKS